MSGILVVDDDELSLSVLEFILQGAGYSVRCAVNGSEALLMARQEVPELIITDVLMPLTDGFELCRRCKADAALRHVPIILYSGDYAGEQDRNLGLSLGASRYLLKPSSRETILTTVSEVLKEHVHADGPIDNSTLDEQMLLLRSYNEVLFNKLETKMQNLQDIIAEHQKSEDALKKMQARVIQQEKMASIGLLAAGVAHEINNPMGFIMSNLTSLAKYVERFETYISALQGSLASCGNHSGGEELERLREKLKIDYITNDVVQLINESMDGANRVRRIVQDLKSFSRVDRTESASINLNEILDTTINVAWNEIKYIATLDRDFGEIPEILCYPQQISQVFLNLLVNAAQSMITQGKITVRTWCDSDHVYVSVTDSGKGIPDEVKNHIFEPFYTTKEVGKGTGLGLSISADIVSKHGGDIEVKSREGAGSTFTVKLPRRSQLYKVLHAD
jgi:signal transduction histidine kinase